MATKKPQPAKPAPAKPSESKPQYVAPKEQPPMQFELPLTGGRKLFVKLQVR